MYRSGKYFRRLNDDNNDVQGFKYVDGSHKTNYELTHIVDCLLISIRAGRSAEHWNWETRKAERNENRVIIPYQVVYARAPMQGLLLSDSCVRGWVII